MNIDGESIIAAPQEKVWEGLNNPDVLRAAIPGCDSLEKVGENQFKARVITKIGPITAKFTGEVELQDLSPPNSYTIAGSGSAGAMGAAKGKALVSLSPHEQGTHLSYQVEADISGRIGQLGGRLIQGTAKILAGQFFDKFSSLVGGEAQAAIEKPEKKGGVMRLVVILAGIATALAILWLIASISAA